MSCIKACFDESSNLYGHEDCHTCPFADNGPRLQRSTNSCQKPTKLVETEQSQSTDLSFNQRSVHRYAGSFGD